MLFRSSDPKAPAGPPTELKLGGMRRTRTVTEPSMYSPAGDVFTPVFNGRGGLPRSPTVSLETSFIGSEEQLARAGGSTPGLGGEGGPGAGGEPPGREREQSSRERLAGGDGGSSSSGGGVGGVENGSVKLDIPASRGLLR